MRTQQSKCTRWVRSANKRARRKGYADRIESEEVSDLWDVTIFCSICGRFIEEADASLDHLVPLANGGLNKIENIVIVHFWCNNLKGDKDMLEASEKILKSYPIEKTGSALIDSLTISLLAPYAPNPVKRSELPDYFGDLPYLEQIKIFDPDKQIERESEIIMEYQAGDPGRTRGQ